MICWHVMVHRTKFHENVWYVFRTNADGKMYNTLVCSKRPPIFVLYRTLTRVSAKCHQRKLQHFFGHREPQVFVWNFLQQSTFRFQSLPHSNLEYSNFTKVCYQTALQHRFRLKLHVQQSHWPNDIVLPGDHFINATQLLNFHLSMRYTSFSVWANWFELNFKGYIWKSPQNVLPIHWKT